MGCKRVVHLSKEDYEREMGSPRSKGNYLVKLEVVIPYCPAKSADLLTIKVNDITGTAEILYSI
ncbi:hypothetical protein Pla110_42470 [Polystyrenella longa]|uniref:Uncharacterized protein n=1 Tax=Polystyrenella longa TaxID=2528007 RepID=A0A518CTD6_9PLAN|nr:hypothetical protein Pla110_42470 [Polystyrenella longa]